MLLLLSLQRHCSQNHRHSEVGTERIHNEKEREQVAGHKGKPTLDGEQSSGKLDVRAEVTALVAWQVCLQRTESACSNALGTAL